MFAFSKWKSAKKDNHSIVLRYYYRTLINKSRPPFGRGRLLFYFLFLSPRFFVSFLSLAKSITNGAERRCYWGVKPRLLQTKSNAILERLQLIVVQSVMRVMMEVNELVKREGDVRDEKRASWVSSWVFFKVEYCFFASRESVFNVEIGLFINRKWIFLKLKTGSFQVEDRFSINQKSIFSNQKISLSPSF